MTTLAQYEEARAALSDDELDRLFEQYERVRFRKGAGTLEREIWIIAARRLFAPGEREPCWICGKFKSITQAHHVVPLTSQYDRGFEYPDGEYVWLCPNHHTIAHMFVLDENPSWKPGAARARSGRTRPIYEDTSEQELEKIIELMRRSTRGSPK